MASPSRRAGILTESARLFAERGVAATSIREIGDAVGLNSGTLYHYFSSKDAIVIEILVSFLSDLVNRYDAVVAESATAGEQVRRIVRISFEVADAHPYATEVYQNEFSNLRALPRYTQIATAVTAAHNAWYRVVEGGVHSGEFNSGVDVFEFQRMMRECVFMSVRWHRTTLRRDIESLTDTLTTVFLNGFAGPPASGVTPRSPATDRDSAAARTPTAPWSSRSPSRHSDDAKTDIQAELDSLRAEMREIRELL